MKKIELAANLIKENKHIFQCPICASSMNIQNQFSLTCDNHHSFDLAKGGYVNLLPHADQSHYPKSLFLARREVSDKCFFNPLIELLVQIIARYNNSEDIAMLDAGCGEGSHLFSISNLIKHRITTPIVGVDIAKDGIKLATKLSSNIIWCISDLAHLPFNSEKFNLILNILSPANYKEFTRILTKDGLVIKVIPNADYLKEIRDIVYTDHHKSNYSNKSVINIYKENLNIINEENISYKIFPDDNYLDNIIKMSPLALDFNHSLLRDKLVNNKLPITASFTVLFGRLKE